MMKNGYLVASILIASLGGYGCGGGETGSNRSNSGKTNSTANVPVNVTNTQVAGANSSTPNAADPAANTNTPPVVVHTPAGSAPGAMGHPAPDNSEVTVVLAQDLTQTRTFKGHPTLDKVVETTAGGDPNKKTIKVYLKNGQAKEIPSSKLPDPMTVPAAKILEALGIK